MDKYILAGLIIIISCLVIMVYIHKKKSKKLNNQDLINKENALKNLGKNVSSSDLLSNKGKIKKASQSANGIINKPIIETQYKKVAQWTESESYEEDLKSLDIDTILQNLKDNVSEAEIKEENNIIKPTILLVDDSMVVRKFVGDLLKKNNYEVIVKNDGVEALNYLNTTKEKPELIISDIEMPNMDGIELIENIRKEKRLQNIPILVISAHAENHLVLMEKESIQGFMKKPFEEADLLNQTNYLINH